LNIKVFKKNNINTKTVVRTLKGAMEEENIKMDPNRQLDSIGALSPAVGSGVSPSTGSDASAGIAKILQDIGPACARNATTLRDTLAEITSTTSNLNEPAIARVIFFFSDKVRDADGSALMGVSSGLLGSLIPGRGNDASADGWNLSAVAQVLEQDYSSLDWAAVATFWDFPGFAIKDADHFRSLIELYSAGAKRTPPLSAFTAHWRNSDGQLSLLEAMAVSQNVYVCPLSEAEAEDAATAAPGSNGMDPRCFASMEILQRLLFLSDIPALYRGVRDLFVKGLLSCPEVLLCSLVRLQLHMANTPAQPGRENLSNAGMQIKTEIMRELIPLFFRPNARHRVQNAPSALRRLYAISPITVTVACFEAWRSTASERPQVALATLMHIINIARLLPSPADAVKSLLDGSKDAEFSIAIAFVMADNEYLQLKPWLVEKFSQKATVGVFAAAILGYVAKTHTSAGPRGGDGEGAPLVSVENIAMSLQILQALDASIVSQPYPTPDGSQPSGATLGDNMKAVTDACLSAHPSLRASLSSQNASTPNSGPNSRGTTPSPGASDDVEEMATAYFQKIYTSEQSIGEVVEMLKRFKMSGNAKENEIFACMVHNLFDEYRFFSKYPEKELRITGILFGTLIQEQLVSSITLGIALRYVLEALRKPPSPAGTSSSSGKMFQFGMFALEQFKGRLHEWPQYCSHIVQIPHLKEGYAELVSEIESAMLESQNRVAGQGNAPNSTPAGAAMGRDQSASSLGATQDGSQSLSVPGSSHSSTASLELPSEVLLPPVDTKPRVAEFGPKLGRAVTEFGDDEREYESPTQAVLDRVQFLVNNLAPANVEKKAQELKDLLEPEYFGWLGQYLVVKRISTQANFHSLYLNFLDQLGEYGKGLVEAIIDSVYHNIGKLLRSPKITTSSSERSYLKNLGIWLGQITLARNRPILQRMLDCKELLLQGYETGKLIAVAPFLAKTLEGAKNSIIFRRPNPWLMGLLGVFRSVYTVERLKMNIKFEVEVLCKNLGIRLEDIPFKTAELQKRVAPIKERNPDFNNKSVVKSQAVTSQVPGVGLLGTPDAKSALGIPGDAQKAAGDEQETVIPNLAAYVTVNQSLSQLLQQSSQGGSSVLASLTSASLKRSVPIAVDRAIREIIQPVVERSVTIACITTKEIVTKDFAMESDENKMRKAGQLMVANLAASLALVTCREPLRSSVSTHLRQLLTANAGGADKLNEQEQNIIEQCVQICATDNLELGCMLIEKAATEKAVRDVDEDLAQSLNARRKHREQTGQPFYDMSIFGNGNQRYPAALPEQLRPKPGGVRAEHFQLYDSFQRMARQTPAPGAIGTPGGAAPGGAGPNLGSELDSAGGQKPGTGPQVGLDALSAVAAKLDSAVTALLSAAGPRAPEIKLPMLPADHQIRQLLGAVKQILPNLNPSGGVTRNLTATEQEAILGFSQGIFKRLYELNLSEPLRLEALVALLENINAACPKLGQDIGTWATYAPTNTEGQRRLHRTVLLLLIRSRLLAVNDLDVFLAARADNGRNHIWVEFSLLFVRTAFVERISVPSDFPKLIELMTRIAEGRSQASPQIMQTYRKPILRMLEETRGLATSNGDASNLVSQQQGPVDQRRGAALYRENSSLSPESLSQMTSASQKVAEATQGFIRNDPPNTKQQVATVLDNWIRVYNEAGGNEKVYLQFLQYMQQSGVGKAEEHTERFLRLSVLLVVEAVLKSATSASNGSRMLNYTVIDVYCKLLVLMFQHPSMGGETSDAQGLNMLNKILGVVVRSMMFDAESVKKAGARAWDQRPWFRIMLNLMIDINKPDPALEPVKLGVLSVFGAAFHVCQPLALPGKMDINLLCLETKLFVI
jgi:CCR4-NOT transcription complex subunit 1